MKRSFNFTGRKEIPSSTIRIHIQRGSALDDFPKFTAELEGLKELNLPPDARVYVEPYVGATVMRFPFGKIADIVNPTDTSLTELDAGNSILFRLKVVDESSDPCLIVASANQLRPVSEHEIADERQAILPVREVADLGEELWTLDIKSDIGPELVINNNVPEFLQRLKSDPFVQGLILPHALREVLKFIFHSETIEDDRPWVEAWLEFASEISGIASPDLNDETEEETIDDYIETCVQRFCTQQQFKTNSLMLNREDDNA
jgi:hypothetical protein